MMGTFFFDTAREGKFRFLKDSEKFMLEEAARHADDNTDPHGYVNKLGRRNIIGEHIYPSVARIAKLYGKDRKNLNSAIASLVKMDLLYFHEDNYKFGETKQYKINVSKFFRIVDYYHTVDTLGLDESTENVKRFFQSAYTSYDHDYTTFPLRNITQREKGIVIEDWEKLVVNGDIDTFWESYREKSVGAADNSTNTENITKEHKEALSIHDDSTSTSEHDNQEDNNEELHHVFPVSIMYKTENNTYKTATFGREQLNCKHLLDPYYFDFDDEQDQEYFLDPKTGGMRQLQEFNKKWHDKLRIYYIPSHKHGSLQTELKLV